MNPGGNPYAPPQAEVADLLQPDAELAGRGLRLLAVVIDGVLQGAAVWLLFTVLPWASWASRLGAGALVFGGALGIAVFVLMQGLLLVRRNQTIGKLLLGLRIRRTHGAHVGAVRVLLLRYGLGMLVGMVPLVGVLYILLDSLLIFRASRQCLHDQIADTQVVRG